MASFNQGYLENLCSVSSTPCINGDSKCNPSLPTLSRENRGFSSLPISIVFEKFNDLVRYTHHNMCTEETAEDLYLTIIAIQGYSTKYPYVLSLLERLDLYSLESPKILSRRGGRWECFIDIQVLIFTEYIIN